MIPRGLLLEKRKNAENEIVITHIEPVAINDKGILIDPTSPNSSRIMFLICFEVGHPFKQWESPPIITDGNRWWTIDINQRRILAAGYDWIIPSKADIKKAVNSWHQEMK